MWVNMKKNCIIIIMLILTILFVITACANQNYEVVGEYDINKLAIRLLNNNSGVYDVGANQEGMPVFKDTDKAFKQIIIDCEDGFMAIQEEFNLKVINKNNFKDYMLYGWQLRTDNDEIREQGMRITEFFDIYENSFK